MANTGYTSPFPTSHDTIGHSTLATPLFMPSSPPQNTSSRTAESPLRSDSPQRVPRADENNGQDRDGGDAHHSDNELQQGSRPGTPRSPSGSDLDARLADYTLDFSRFPSGQFGAGTRPLPELKDDAGDNLSDVGGPEDFTANMEKYLMGEDEEAPATAKSSLRQSSQHPDMEDEADSSAYSEFGPPVDMSTPSHLLHGGSALGRDSTHLEDIEEEPRSPSVRKQSTTSSQAASDREEGLRQRIAELENALQDRDEKLQRNRRRVLEAASAGEQIRHLQTELQRKTELLDVELSKRADEQPLQRSTNGSDLTALQQRVRTMQQQLQSRDSQDSLDAERLETIAHLRQQLDLTQEQLRKRDVTLDDTVAKLREVTRAKEVQLQQKNTEIDELKAQMDDQALENERLEREVDRIDTEYHDLEERFTELEDKNRPLEEKNHTLEADLTRVQSRMSAQESALKAAAADLPDAERNTYTEILDLIKDLGVNSPPESPMKQNFSHGPDVQLHQENMKLEQELEETKAAQKAADAEVSRLRDQTTESQTLIKTIEAENSRLASRVEELTASLSNTQRELAQTREEHAGSLETVARLQEDKIPQPPSPPLTPAATRNGNNPEQHGGPASDQEASHQAQLRSLQTAHSTAITTLRSSHAESMRKMRNLLTAAEQREAELQAELSAMRVTSSGQESELRRTFKAEINRLECIIAAKDESAVAVDQRIAMSVDRREREWERRVQLLLKERDRMGKALLQAWGEKELGKGPGALSDGKEKEKESRRRDADRGDVKQGQAYQYKYASKHRSRSGENKA
ncbi:hypothetical protein N7474_000240 [Penicillium riverlandense]|uniref:uncharacterized protein n=1 Tax=Penicillium riverlandense TaxID=1903569 RepID=UPI00254877BD|nr:uncharacterized protein N7474_000240 [Penicillium riverlandense]KAJ5831929.1 hypothetical protein N7474_000240 [Penicillium riverlandense]